MSQDPDYAVYREVKGRESQWPSVALKPAQQPGFKHTEYSTLSPPAWSLWLGRNPLQLRQKHSLHSQRKETFERTQRGKSQQPSCEWGICDVPIQHPLAFAWLPARLRTATTLTGNRRKLRLSSEAGPQCGFSRRTRLLCHLSAEPSENILPPYEIHSTSLVSREHWALSITTWRQENKQRHQLSHRVLHTGEAGWQHDPIQ